MYKGLIGLWWLLLSNPQSEAVINNLIGTRDNSQLFKVGCTCLTQPALLGSPLVGLWIWWHGQQVDYLAELRMDQTETCLTLAVPRALSHFSIILMSSVINDRLAKTGPAVQCKNLHCTYICTYCEKI